MSERPDIPSTSKPEIEALRSLHPNRAKMKTAVHHQKEQTMNPGLQQAEAHLKLLDMVKGVEPLLRKQAALADGPRTSMKWRLIVLLLAVSFCVASSSKVAPPVARVYISHVTVV